MSGDADNLPPRPRRAVAPRWVLLGLGASFVVALLVAVFLYQKFVAFERVAARHVLRDADLAVYVDLEKVVLYEPFRTHLLPLILKGKVDSRLKPRLTRLKQHTRVELGVDIRELVFSQQRAGGWALAVGGMFPNTGIAAGIQRVLEEEGRKAELDGPAQVLLFSNGTYAAQAADSVVVFASDKNSLESALKARASASLGVLPVQVQLTPGADTSGVTKLTARLVPGEPYTLNVLAKLGGGPNPSRVRTWVCELLQKWGQVEPTTVRFEVAGPNEVRGSCPVTPANLDHAAAEFAQTIRDSAFSVQ